MKVFQATGSKSHLNHSNQWSNFDPGKRVFSGVSAILDFEIINFRPYDCSKEPGLPNCQIVELFLTVDTSRKMQNGVNIDISIDRCEFCDFYMWLLGSNKIFRGMDILKNDVIAILSQKVNSTRNGHFSKLSSGADKKQFKVGELGAPANMSFAL